MKIFILMVAFTLSLSLSAFGQPRPADKSTTPVNVPDAPPSFEAKYQGGMFGYSEKQNGTLKIDEINERIVFYGTDGKEKFALPFTSMQVVYPQSKSVTSNTGNVVRHIPLPGSFLGGLIKEKWRYLVISFDDQDVDAVGNINFKLSSKELLESVIKSIGTKAKMTQRGDAYYRPRPTRRNEI
jgi:hypothetical protein